MKSALALMTILGCDDTATQCHYIRTVETGWETVELCERAIESRLTTADNHEYPVLVAVCEAPRDPVERVVEQTPAAPAMQSEFASDGVVEIRRPQAEIPPPGAPMDERSVSRQALDSLRAVLPSAEGLKKAASAPVRYAGQGYAWVARRLPF